MMIERFMLVFGSASSLFDLITFYVLLRLFDAGEALFQTGWFVESLVTQVLIVVAIRTRRRLYNSRPHRLLVGLALVAVIIAVALPLSPVGHWFGFVAPPLWFFGYLIVVTFAYVGLVELIKHFFYRKRDLDGPTLPPAQAGI
ncbi:cation transport ATPase-like protein [Tahibacter aquaticus]|uniref:Cation transport ATPase-like protein n=2 Tax=Tahibacter aquaticus TaxID=520092 RepID=A0A4V3DN27_9GAMM|nr:cation transport ATPase-like protein [Tahibacter aquaticus]